MNTLMYYIDVGCQHLCNVCIYLFLLIFTDSTDSHIFGFE